MRLLTLLATAAQACMVMAAPFSYPLANGFPKINMTSLEEIFKLAGGTTPNVSPPTSLKDGGVQTLQLIAANELLEIAFFIELLQNITSHVPGYETNQYIIDSLTSIVNQEQVHALSANGVLSRSNNEEIQPCQYNFPVDNFDDAIRFAQTFTDVVLGVLPLAQTQFAADGGDESVLIPVVGSMIAQEGEQNGLYRSLQKKVASAAPMLTGGAPQLAYSAISRYIVPGSCPNIDIIGLKTFPALKLETVPEAKNSTQLFSVDGHVTAGNASMVYLSGQNVPVAVPISNTNTQGGRTFFFAPFPYDSSFARGLTIGILVSGSMPVFNTSAEAAAAAATIYGPALIEVD